MLKNTKRYWISLVLAAALPTLVFAAPESGSPHNGSRQLAQILQKMETASNELQTLSSDMEYLLIQEPDLIDARTLRKGKVYYRKGDNGRSQLLISFQTRQQDEGKVLNRPEYYLFDGVWLTKVDVELETIDRYQEAPEDRPIGVFEFISHNFPMVGFTDPNNLEKEFEITIPEDQPAKSTHLHLEVREGSVYSDDYRELDVWVDNQTWLPTRLTAVSTQEDFYDLKWTHVEINKKLENGVFTIETPAHFSKNTHPLKQGTERK